MELITHLLEVLKSFYQLKKSDIDKNIIVADEYVFPYKYQIIPICSFTVMRTDYCTIWKDEHIKNSENTKYIKALKFHQRSQ